MAIRILYTVRAAVSAMLFCTASTTPADTLTWVNPAGGSFTDTANWDMNRVPGRLDLAVIQLSGAPYTVTLPENIELSELRLGGVGLTLALQGHTVQIGRVNVSGYRFYAAGSVRVEHGRIILGWGSATIAGDDFRATDLLISDSQLYGGTAGRILEVSGRTTLVDSFFFCTSVRASGTVDLTRSSLQGYGATLTSATLRGGGFTSVQTTNVVGPVHAFDHVHISGPASAPSGSATIRLQGDILIEGPESTVDNPGRVQGGETRIGAGVHVTGTAPVSVMQGGKLTLMDGAEMAPLACPDATSVLRIEAGASLRRLQIPSQPTARLEIGIDAARTPPLIPSPIFYNDVMGGTLAIELQHANRLRSGDSFVLFTTTGTLSGNFSQVILPTLHGHRLPVVFIEPQQVVLRILPGGDPCFTADFNGDGVPGTDADIEAFFRCLGGNCCTDCASVDFN